MKNIIRLSFAVSMCLTLVTPSTSFAQGQGNNTKQEEVRDKSHRGRRPTLRDIVEQKKEEAQARQDNSQDKVKHNKADKENKGDYKHSDKENKGNAYGRNKGELSGREFGQARAATAQLTGEQKRQYLQETITYGDNKARDARTRINNALETLEQDRKARKITEDTYYERKARISRVEQAVKALEEKILAGKQLIVTLN
jgi:colicin import membrane protein